MVFQLNQNFKALKKEILMSLENFDSFDNVFETGNRNSVKKIKLSEITLIIKSFKIPKIINQIVYKYFRKSKAKRSFEYANKLIELGFKTPIPIAYIEHFSVIGLQKSYYISEFVNAHLTYRELILQPDYPDREEILRAFTKFTFELHEKGIEFLDHSPGNTLIIKNRAAYDFYLVDLNRMKFRHLNFKNRMKNFSRLTPQKEMVKIMSEEYAKLIKVNSNKVFNSMWFYTKKFFKGTDRKKRFKKVFLLKK
jgi:hypothetical protein